MTDIVTPDPAQPGTCNLRHASASGLPAQERGIMAGNDGTPGKLQRVRNRLDHARRHFAGLIFDPKLSRTYWPDERCKSKPRIAAELLWWLARHREINSYYYVYGLDRTTQTRGAEVIALPQFRRLRDSGNLPGRWSYVCILRDKLLFARVAASLNIPTPRVYAVLDAKSIAWLDRNATEPLEALTADSTLSLDGFCKPLLGIQGDGAFALRVDRGRLLVSGKEIALDELRNMLDSRCLLQHRIEQHPAVSALHASSINTVRLITFCRHGRVTLFSAASRIGTHGKSVDNWAAGGLIVRIDPQSGELRGEGFFKPGYGGRVTIHPDSNIRFEGYAIPYFREAVAMVARMHEGLPGIHSIGWDVAISPDGPVIIEGNDDWEGGIPMVLEADFRRRFLQMYAAV
jgi:hypothetical protein